MATDLLEQRPASQLVEVAERPAQEIAEFTSQEQLAAELRKKYALVPDTKTKDGYELARIGRAELRDLRVAVDVRRKFLKEPGLVYGRAVEAQAKALTTLIEEVEEPLDAAIKVADDEKARVKAAKEQAERDRIEAEIRQQREAEEEELRLRREADEEKKRKEREADEARLKIERDQLAKEQAKLKADRDKLEKEQREEKKRLAEEQKKRDAEAEAKRKEQEAEQLALEEQLRQAEKAEQDRKDAEEKAKADAAEAARQEAMKPDKQKIFEWAASLLEVDGPVVESEEAIQKVAAGLDAIREIAEALQQWAS